MEKETPLTPMVQSVKDLKFKVHPDNVNWVQAKHTFENGITILIEGGEGLYGDGYESFEVSAWNGNDLLKLATDSKFLYYAYPRQVNEAIQMILENKLK
jgi:hypothetical protein